jgi:hypothetical protein
VFGVVGSFLYERAWKIHTLHLNYDARVATVGIWQSGSQALDGASSQKYRLSDAPPQTLLTEMGFSPPQAAPFDR